MDDEIENVVSFDTYAKEIKIWEVCTWRALTVQAIPDGASTVMAHVTFRANTFITNAGGGLYYYDRVIIIK